MEVTAGSRDLFNVSPLYNGKFSVEDVREIGCRVLQVSTDHL